MFRDSQGIIINGKEYTLNGIPGEFFLNGSPSFFPDPETRLPIVETSGRHKDGYFFAHYENQRYPRKGVITPPMLKALNFVKATLKEGIFMIIKTWWLAPFWFGIRWRLLEYWAVTGDRALREYYVPPGHSVPVAQAFYKACQKTFEHQKLTERQRWIVDRCVLFIGLFLEGDDSYRYRVQDIAYLLNKESFKKNPTKELQRLIGIFFERDIDARNPKSEHGGGMRVRFVTWAKALPWVMRIPSIKRNMNLFIEHLDLEKCRLDDGDFYQCLLRYDYNYRGMDYEHRFGLRMKIDQEYAKMKENAST